MATNYAASLNQRGGNPSSAYQISQKLTNIQAVTRILQTSIVFARSTLECPTGEHRMRRCTCFVVALSGPTSLHEPEVGGMDALWHVLDRLYEKLQGLQTNLPSYYPFNPATSHAMLEHYLDESNSIFNLTKELEEMSDHMFTTSTELNVISSCTKPEMMMYLKEKNYFTNLIQEIKIKMTQIDKFDANQRPGRRQSTDPIDELDEHIQQINLSGAKRRKSE